MERLHRGADPRKLPNLLHHDWRKDRAGKVADDYLIPHSPWSLESPKLFAAFFSTTKGLSHDEARKRLDADGPNEVQSEKTVPGWLILFRQFSTPLTLILMGASLISFALGQGTSTIIILMMVFLSGILAFVQEYRSERSLRQLRKRLTRYAMVIRNGKTSRVDARTLVAGDLVELELGTVIPADLRMVSVEDLEIDESVITGESQPVPKGTDAIGAERPLPQELVNMAFMGTHVVQGSGVGIVVATGKRTEVGKTASLLAERVEETDFQKGIHEFGNFLLKVILCLSLAVAITLGLLRGQWADSLLFALALALGISPELLPVIVTINLSRGALAMSKKNVLIKRLIAIEDLGNADVFCTDKTGTLTVGKIRVRGSIAPDGTPNDVPLAYAAHCTERNAKGRADNPIDQAILDMTSHGPVRPAIPDAIRYDIVSFDFKRRRMSCVVGAPKSDDRWIVVKGATAEVVSACTTAAGYKAPLGEKDRAKLLALADEYHDKGYRLIAVARKPIQEKKEYGAKDERDLDLLGFLLVSDAPKETAKAALVQLADLNARIIVLTGDNEHVTRHVCKQLGFAITGIVTGDAMERMDDAQLGKAVETSNVFARITPAHKLRVIQALKRNKHTVGFMGDGVNDAPALRAADVGISFDDAVDVAKEAAGVILLKKNLSVLADGIREGRRTFVNTRTYIYSMISSNFGNMLSVAGASILLPFIPLLPYQILLLNLLGDFAMLSISGDRVADEDLRFPLKWDIGQVSNFMYFFGIISSLADYATFGLLLFVARADIALFRSGWFIESLLTEVAVIFLLRTKTHTMANRPGLPLIATAVVSVMAAIAIVHSPVGTKLGFVPVNASLFVAILAILAGYALLVELGKKAYYKLRKAEHASF